MNVYSQQQNTLPLPFQLYADNHYDFVVIAHRGASAYHPENTMSAFRAAYEMGADMIELDILLSKDGIPVVIHDETLQRTTNGKGKVEDFTLQQLKKLDAGSWFSKNHSGEQIPTLEEVLKFANNKISLNIEIKTEAVTDKVKNGIEEKSLDLVKKYGMQEHVIFSSFDYRALNHLRDLDENIPIALLYNKNESKGRSPNSLVKEYDVNAFNCSYKQFSKKWAKESYEHSFPVFVYTVNKKRRMKKMINRGARGVFSDKPDVLTELVNNLWKTKQN